MRLGKELIGKPIFSVTDGRQIGTVKDLYLDLDVGILNGIFLGSEGLINRKSRVIDREKIVVLGIDAVLVSDSDVVTDNIEKPEVEVWLRRKTFQGRRVETTGGTKVAIVGDILLDEEANVIGLALSQVEVRGPLTEKPIVLKTAVTETGGKEGIVTIDLAKAEQQDREMQEGSSIATDEPPLAILEPAPEEEEDQ
jgi:uncharacterized protein YrrD